MNCGHFIAQLIFISYIQGERQVTPTQVAVYLSSFRVSVVINGTFNVIYTRLQMLKLVFWGQVNLLRQFLSNKYDEVCMFFPLIPQLLHSATMVCQWCISCFCSSCRCCRTPAWSPWKVRGGFRHKWYHIHDFTGFCSEPCLNCQSLVANFYTC